MCGRGRNKLRLQRRIRQAGRRGPRRCGRRAGRCERTSAMLAASAAPPVRLADAGEQERGDRLGGDALRLGRGEGAAMCGRHGRGGDLGLGRDRVGDELAAGQAEPGAHAVGAGDRRRVVEAQRRGRGRCRATRRPGARPGRRRSPGRRGSPAPRASSAGRGSPWRRAATTVTGVSRELLEVGGDVEARLGAAMHAADAAGGEDLDAGEPGADHRRGDGGRRRSSPRRAPRRGRRARACARPRRRRGREAVGRRGRCGSRRPSPRSSPGRRRRRGPRPRRRGRSRGSPARACRG